MILRSRCLGNRGDYAIEIRGSRRGGRCARRMRGKRRAASTIRVFPIRYVSTTSTNKLAQIRPDNMSG